MKKKNIYCLLIVISLVLFSVVLQLVRNLNNIQIENIENDKKTEYLTSTYITENMKNNNINKVIMTEKEHAYTPEFMLDNSEIVALVTVISLDGINMEYGPLGMTYGKLLVNNVLYGNIEEGKVIEYLKPGGIVSMEDYDKYDFPAAVQKRDYLNQKNGIVIDKENTYIRLGLEEDIDLEAGKTYLVYLNYIEEFDKYEIIGEGNGLREVNINQVSRVSQQNMDINNLSIKNNKTGEWENLNTYVQQNINTLEEK